jgi:DNA-binding NarL/FixJ family response regulator
LTLSAPTLKATLSLDRLSQSDSINEFARQPDQEENHTSLPDDLTEREHEAPRLLARRMSNREIAAHMFISEATAKTYVSRLLTELGVRDRVQAVVVAYETGVVRPGSSQDTT